MTSQHSVAAANCAGSAMWVRSVRVPSGFVTVIRTKGVSGAFGDMYGGLVWNSTVTVEPSSRCASKYHLLGFGPRDDL